MSNKALFLFVNTGCDIACEYCYYTTGHEKRDSNEFDIDKTEDFANRIKAIGFSTVILVGGDPFSVKYKTRCFSLIKSLRKNQLRVIVNSSGAFLNDDDCKKIIDANPSRIDFSFDSHLEETHNHLRGRFNDTVNAIRFLVSNGFTNIATMTVVNKRNIAYLKSTIEFIKSLGIKDTRIHPVFIPDSPKKENATSLSLQITNEERNVLNSIASEHEYSVEYKRYMQYWELYYGMPNIFNANTPNLHPVCSMGKTHFICDSDGNLTACFHRKDIELGNIFKENSQTISRNLETNIIHDQPLPSCVGKHCISLFEDKDNWQ